MSQSLGRSSSKGSSSKRQLRQPGQHEPPTSTPSATLNTAATGLSRGWTIAARIGATNSNGQIPLHQYRHPLPMCAARELRPRRAPYKGQESAAEPKQTALQRARRRGETDRCYQPPHRPLRPRSTERELRPRRAPVTYHESDDDERPPPRPGPRARRAAADRRHQATRRPSRPEYQKRYRAKHRERILETDKRYRERHRERIREKDRRYFHANKERILARQQRYREAHREEVRENQRRYRESRREEAREKQRRYRESHREELREQERQRYARYREAHPELVREQNRIRQARFRAKKRMEKLRTLTIPLTDCRTSMPVTDYIQTFCDSLDSVDTPLPESQDSVDTPLPESQDSVDTPLPESQDSVDTPLPESFLQLLEEDGPTRLDSGTMQGGEPSDLDDLSFLSDLLSLDEWEQVRDDVQDFDVEAFVADWLEDMTSSDEGVDLMYDLVS